MVALVEEAMSKQPAAPGFLLDGFPANLAQARLCRERLGDPVKVILLEVPDHVMMSRYRPPSTFTYMQTGAALPHFGRDGKGGDTCFFLPI